MPGALILTPSILRRIDRALEKSGVPKNSLGNLQSLLLALGRKIYRGTPVEIRVAQICKLVKRCDRTVRTWLNRLNEAGILIKEERAGVNGLVLRLAKPFVYFRPRPDETKKDSRLEEAIDERILEMGEKVENAEGLRRFLRENMSPEEIRNALERRASRLAPAPEPEVSEPETPVRKEVEDTSEEPEEAPEPESAEDTSEKPEEAPEVAQAAGEAPKKDVSDAMEAARYRVEEKKTSEGFEGFKRGERSYLHGTLRSLERDPDQVREILARKKAAQAKREKEERQRQEREEKLSQVQSKAEQEAARRRELLDSLRTSPEEHRAVRARAEAKLQRNIRELRASHPVRIAELERLIIAELEQRSEEPQRDLREEFRRRLEAKA